MWTALIAGAAAVVGSAVPVITGYLTAQSERKKGQQDRTFERDRSWEKYQTGLRQCYQKLLDGIEDSELTEDGLINSKDIGNLRRNYYEAYFAGDEAIVGLLEKFWPPSARNDRKPPDPSIRQDLLRAMRAQTKRTRMEQDAIDNTSVPTLRE